MDCCELQFVIFIFSLKLTFFIKQNGTEIASNNEDFILIHDKQVLRINTVNKDHQNDFYCLVSNSFASLQRYFHITVLTKAQWSKFTPWTPCSETCGKGFQVRTRICLMSNGEKPLIDVKCEGDDFESQTCIISECIDDNGWKEWSDFTPCSKTCGTGYQVKRRQCKIQKDFRGVGKCEGSAEEYKYCKNPAC
jgi:Thrombospondin type 1 domain